MDLNSVANEKKAYQNFTGNISWGSSNGDVMCATFSLEMSANEKIICWQDGKWCDGVWANGIWQSGEWEGGTWKSGIWLGGIWKNGIWIRGWNSLPLLPQNQNEIGSLVSTRWKDMIVYNMPPSKWQINVY